MHTYKDWTLQQEIEHAAALHGAGYVCYGYDEAGKIVIKGVTK